MEPTIVVSDPDLQGKSAEFLSSEVMKLRSEIRYHRDQKGHDRCWLDDVKLYKALPEGASELANFRLPCREEFMQGCKRFWETRQEKPEKLHEW